MRTYNRTGDIVSQLNDACDLETEPRELGRLCGNASSAIAELRGERDELQQVLRNHGFVECDIAACNCGSWHPRYGLPRRMHEISDALSDAGVLNNSTGNLALNAIRKLVVQRDELLAALNKIVDECYTPLPSRETLADIYKIAAVAIDLAGAPIACAEGNQTTKEES